MAEQWRTLTATELTSADNELALRANAPFGQFTPGGLTKRLIQLGRGSFLKRGAFRVPFARLIVSLAGTPLDIQFRGCGYRIQCSDNLIECGMMLNPGYNGADLDFLLADAPADANFVDIGSNIGLFALPLAKAAPNGSTVAIDANPLMAQRLQFNATGSGLSNVTMLAVAISDADGQGALKIRRDDVAIVALEESADGDIPIRTLLSVLNEQNIQSIYGLKIDIEGLEDKALVPFLNAAPPALLPQRIVIEHSRGTDYPGCLDAFNRLGYTLIGRSRNNSFYQHQAKR